MSKKSTLDSYGASLVFVFCKGVPDLAAVKAVAHLLGGEGLHPSPARSGIKLLAPQDIDALAEDNFHDWQARYGGKLPRGLSVLRDTGFPLLMDGFPPERSHCAFGWYVFEGGDVSVNLGGAVFAHPEERRMWQERFAQKLLSVALKLYPLVQPTYGFMADDRVEHHPSEHDEIASRQRIATLTWVNFFGPEYVAKHGRKLLTGIPGYRTADLPDGGVLYQSRPSIVIEDEAGHQRWQREAAAYLAAHGIRIEFH